MIEEERILDLSVEIGTGAALDEVDLIGKKRLCSRIFGMLDRVEQRAVQLMIGGQTAEQEYCKQRCKGS